MGGSTSENFSKKGSENTSSGSRPTGIAQYESNFAQDYKKTYGDYQNLMNTPLNLKEAPLYSTQLDPVVQNTISKGLQGIKAKQATQGRQTASALGTAGSGSNTSLINVLNRQSAIAGAGAGNQLQATGLEQQRQYDIARQAMIAQQNQSLLQKRQLGIQGIGQGASLLQRLTEMAGVARGEKKWSKKDYEESGQTTGSKSFV